MFNFIKNSLKKIYQSISSKLSGLFASPVIDHATLHELEKILLEADTGITITKMLIEYLEAGIKNGLIVQGSDLKNELSKKLTEIVSGYSFYDDYPVYLLVGINGSGKTTTAAKIAYRLKKQGKKVLLVAGDTFRAAATEQLVEWGKKIEVEVVVGRDNQDPASVVFDACERYRNERFDYLIIDTAGRLQTKVNLMRELEKIGKIIAKQLVDKRIATLLTVDSMLGQNSFDQAKLFNESTQLTGLVVTKFDGTAKGGIVFSIIQALKVPVAFIAFGEKLDDIKPFDANEYVTHLLSI